MATFAPGISSGIVKTSTLQTAATDGQLAGNVLDKFSRQIVIPQTIRDLVVDGNTTITASTSETTILAQVASVFLDLTAIAITNTSSTGCRVDIRDATAGTVRFSFYIPPNDVRGMVLQVPRPQTAVNNNWTATCSASITDIRIWIQAIKNQ